MPQRKENFFWKEAHNPKPKNETDRFIAPEEVTNEMAHPDTINPEETLLIKEKIEEKIRRGEKLNNDELKHWEVLRSHEINLPPIPEKFKDDVDKTMKAFQEESGGYAQDEEKIKADEDKVLRDKLPALPEEIKPDIGDEPKRMTREERQRDSFAPLEQSHGKRGRKSVRSKSEPMTIRKPEVED